MGQASVNGIVSSLWPAGQLVATTEQLQAAGLATRLLEAGVQGQLLHRLRRGVYIPMHEWQGKPPWVQNKLALLGHVVQSGGVPIHSHLSAAQLHGLHTWNSSGADPHQRRLQRLGIEASGRRGAA